MRSYVLFDQFDGLRDGRGEDVSVGPGLGAQLGLLVSSHCLEGGDLAVDLHHGTEHPDRTVRYELLTDRLEPPVHVLLGVQEVLLDGGSGVENELQQGVVTAQ